MSQKSGFFFRIPIGRRVRTDGLVGEPSALQRTQGQFAPSISGVTITTLMHFHFETTPRWAMTDNFEKRRATKRVIHVQKDITVTWLLHHDNTPSHTSMYVLQFLVKHNMATMPQSTYGPNHAPADFFLFPRIETPSENSVLIVLSLSRREWQQF